jgi:hypothetical protein
VRYLESYSAFELRLPPIRVGGKELPEVVLPKRAYGPQETAEGKCSVIELDDDALERLDADYNFKGMLMGKQYRWVDGMPAKYMSIYQDDSARAAGLTGLRVKLISIGAEPFSAGIEPFAVMEPRA